MNLIACCFCNSNNLFIQMRQDESCYICQHTNNIGCKNKCCQFTAKRPVAVCRQCGTETPALNGPPIEELKKALLLLFLGSNKAFAFALQSSKEPERVYAEYYNLYIQWKGYPSEITKQQPKNR